MTLLISHDDYVIPELKLSIIIYNKLEKSFVIEKNNLQFLISLLFDAICNKVTLRCYSLFIIFFNK